MNGIAERGVPISPRPLSRFTNGASGLCSGGKEADEPAEVGVRVAKYIIPIAPMGLTDNHPSEPPQRYLSMSFVKQKRGALSVTAYRGDFKTLLAFDLDKSKIANLAGFTIAAQPKGQAPYYLLNQLQFKTPGDHAQDSKEPPNSSINAPFHKFRWVHIPGMFHQGLTPFAGLYTYSVTPRYFDRNGSLVPLDASLSVAVTIDVMPFTIGNLELGFTRGYTQSQAFVHHFGKNARIQPAAKSRPLLFDTSQESGQNAAGQTYTFLDEYQWLGFTARTKIFAILQQVLNDASLHLDMFAYDLNEPDILKALLKLGSQKRVRIILDNASLHHDSEMSKPEDQFETAFRKVAGGGDAPIIRGHFKRYSHDKVLIVSQGGHPLRVLTGSTNFSVTGMYVNSNHVLVFNDPAVAAAYSDVFDMAWDSHASEATAVASPEDTQSFRFASSATPAMDITFAPHVEDVAVPLLNGIADRIKAEGKSKADEGSVLFAVMAIDQGHSPVYDELKDVHADESIFSYGISDNPGGIALYKPGRKDGILVTGKPIHTILPPPFDQVPNIGGVGHQVHHKFVVCSFNDPSATTVCGSSNLAIGGEEQNGDNLLEIYNQDVTTVFAIEAVTLVDHFQFLDRYQTGKKGAPKQPVANSRQGALDAQWFLSTSDAWVKPFYDPNDTHSVDRELFAAGTPGNDAPPSPLTFSATGQKKGAKGKASGKGTSKRKKRKVGLTSSKRKKKKTTRNVRKRAKKGAKRQQARKAKKRGKKRTGSSKRRKS